MRLNYFREPNFGDALNPLIFDRLLPDFFDDDDSIDFFGIGSIIGFHFVRQAKRKVVFSSGFAYGELPEPDNTFDFVCVRGPATAKVLNLDRKLAVTDGAALLREFNYPARPKKYRFSFMPHWRSEQTYAWKDLCEEADIHYISPMDNTDKILGELLETEVMLAEAMHAAIVADTLRVPWIPVKAYAAVNDFKWDDWASSLNMEYAPNPVHSVCLDNNHVLSAINRKLGFVPAMLHKPIASGYGRYQNFFQQKSAIKQLRELKNKKQYLSADNIFNSKVDQLLEKIHEVKARYPQNHRG